MAYLNHSPAIINLPFLTLGPISNIT